MNTPGTQLAITTPAPDDDAHLVGEALTTKQERFARAWAETGNKAAAYRIAYNVGERTTPNTVWVSANRVAGLAKVQARYKVLTDQLALEDIMSIRALYKWATDIATADPNEVTRVLVRNCRYCRGVDYGYQWKDEIEYIDACVVALDNKTSPPNDNGGYGFNGALEPVAECTHCFGIGVEQVSITDTTKLTGKARRLYAGAEQDRFGVVKVKLHDQKAYHEMACRMAGAFNDKLDIRTPEERARLEAKAKMSENVTVENAAKAYLELIK